MTDSQNSQNSQNQRADDSREVRAQALTPDELFAVPASRPMPDHLASRIEAELAEAPEPAERRPTRWLAPLVAASMVAAVMGGAYTLQHRRVDVPASPTSSSSPAAPDASTTPQDVSGCLSAVSTLSDPSSDPSAASTTKLLATAGGVAELAHVGTSAALCAGGQSSVSVVPDTTASSIMVMQADLAGARTVLVAGGRMTPGSTGVTIDDQAAVVKHGWWVWARALDTAAMAQEPAVRAAYFSHPASSGSASDADVRYLSWPGRRTTATLPTSAAAASSCAKRFDTPAWSLVTADHSTVLEQVASGTVLCGTGTNLADGVAAVPMAASYSGNDETTNAFTTAAYGTVPAGTTAVTVSSSLGTEKATIGHGHWVWAHTAPSQQMGLLPLHYTVHFAGSTQADAVVNAATLTQDELGTDLPSAATGDDLAGHNPIPGTTTASAVSSSGHVRVSRVRQDGKPLVVVYASGAAIAQDATSPLAASTFALTLDKDVTTSGSARLAIGGGALPAGVTSIVYTTPHGAVPATIDGDLFAAEVYLPSGGTADLPTSVTVTANGVQHIYQLR